MNGRVPQGTIDAARSLLAEVDQLRVHQVHKVILRDIDANEDNPRILHLVPIGGVLGVAITREAELPEDADFIFVSMEALGAAMPALGFHARPPVAYLVPPERAK